jgi:hypothetical protein
MTEIELAGSQVRADESAARFQDARTLSFVLLLAGLARQHRLRRRGRPHDHRPLGRVHSVLARWPRVT